MNSYVGEFRTSLPKSSFTSENMKEEEGSQMAKDQ